MDFPVIDPIATGQNIKILREEKGLTVRDLQAFFDFEEPQAIYRWQYGKTLPSVDNLYALSAILEVPMERILIPVTFENVKQLEKQQEALKQEILKSITGESPLDTDTLQSMLCENKAAIKACEDALVECRRERENEEAKLDYLSSQYKNISDWAEVFDDASIEEKKMILAKIIERIEVDRHYHLTIHFFVTLSDFETMSQVEGVTVVEADDCRATKVG